MTALKSQEKVFLWKKEELKRTSRGALELTKAHAELAVFLMERIAG